MEEQGTTPGVDGADASAAPDASSAAARRSQAGKRRGKPKKRHTVATALLGTVLVLALVTGLGVVFAYRHLQGNLTVTDPFETVDNRPDDYDTGPQQARTILVMGLDTREGENAIDGEQGMDGSDTTILLHLSADRKRAYGISIPRDSVVTRPDCGADNEIPGAENAMWNVAYSRGQESCTVEQFELNTGVRVDDTITVDFTGFKDMVDAIGGVPMCIPYEIHDPWTKTTFKKGERVLKGKEALAYVRMRHIGTGSDLDRIVRQQNFVASMVNKTVSKGTLARVDRVYKFLNAATKSLEVSEGLQNLRQLAGLGAALNGIGLDNIQFLTVPNEAWVENPNRVIWKPEAQEMWNKIAKDKPLSAKFTDTAVTAEKDQKPSQSKPDSTPSASPSDDPSASPSAEPDEADEAAREEARERAERMGLCG